MDRFQLAALITAGPGVVALLRSFDHWGRAAQHVRPGAPRYTPFVSWLQDGKDNYTAEGQRHLALSVRWRFAGLAFLAAAVVLNILAHRNA
jgi:hypothetical protein